MTRPDEPDEPRGPVGAVEYGEERSYVEVLLVIAVLAVGFGIDVGFDASGALTHLPGWLIAVGLVAGIDAILVASVRATRSLVVTADEVWVGDEMITRADIAGVVAPDIPDLPVLGWPSGKQGKTKGVALRLDDGRDVLVPARHPEQLAAVLDVDEAAPREPAAIRDATDDDMLLLAEVDERAGIVFGLAGVDLPEIPFVAPDDAVAIFVADDSIAGVVGFVALTEVDGLAHIEEIAVVPSVMRTGLGSRLLEHACTRARDAGYAAVTLCTFADVAWNGPWYVERGFVAAEPTAGLRALRDRERELGLDAAGRRIVMRRELG